MYFNVINEFYWKSNKVVFLIYILDIVVIFIDIVVIIRDIELLISIEYWKKNGNFKVLYYK